MVLNGAGKRRGRPPGPSAADDTRGRILAAAEEVFGERGFRDAVVDDIALRSGTSKGTFYFHFPSKQAIFLALFEGQADRLARGLEESVAHVPSALGRAEAALRATLEIFADHRRLARLLLLDVADLGGPIGARTHALHERFARIVQAQLETAIATGELTPPPGFDAAVAAAAWTGALNEVIIRWLSRGEPADLRDALPTLRPLLLGGVGLKPSYSAASVSEPPAGSGDPPSGAPCSSMPTTTGSWSEER